MIPKILHYCFGMTPDFGGKPWSLVHHVCVASAVERIRPIETLFYYEYEPTGAWWQLTRELVTPVKIAGPRTIFGNPVLHPAHRADVIRLEKLTENGGIYLDADVFVHRDFDDLLNHSTVLGAEEGVEGSIGICNAVILAEPEAPFVRRWYDEYKSFRSHGHDRYWNEHSVKVPLRLAREHPDEVTVLPHTAFFWPTWQQENIGRLFHSTESILGPGVYANHLWESHAWDAFLEDLTPGRVRSIDSNFHRWVRPLVATLTDSYGAASPVRRFLRATARAGRRMRSLGRRHLQHMKRYMVAGTSTGQPPPA